MDPSFASLEQGELHGIEHGIHPTIEDLPDDILAKSLLGMEAPFSHRRICKQLRSLFDESRTQLRLHVLPDPSAAHGVPVHGESSLDASTTESVFQHSDLLSLLRRLPHLDTLSDMDRRRSQALPWEEMGQILGGQLTCLVFQCDRHPGFLELFPLLRRLEMTCSEHLCTVELQPLSALHALRHFELSGMFIKDLGPLTGCRQLQLLDLSSCPLEDLGPLVHCTALHTLKLTGIIMLRDIAPLGACASLQHLELNSCSFVTNLKPLELCTNLLHLDLSFSCATDFEALSSCTNLQHLCLFRCLHLHSLAPLASCRKLQHLDIHMSTISSLEPLWGLQELQHLDLRGTRISRLGDKRAGLELGPLKKIRSLLLHFSMPPGF